MKLFFKNATSALFAIVILISFNARVGGQLIFPPQLPVEEGKLVKFWLDEAWDKGLANNEKSVSVYDASTPKDANVNLAYAINRLQHNRTAESAAAVEVAKSKDPNNIDAVMLSIWLEVLRDDFDVALIEMQTFADIVAEKNKAAAEPGGDAANDAANDADNRALDFAYRRLGRLMGYLQGPVAGQCNPDIFARSVDRINAVSSDRHQKILQQQSESVIAKYDLLLKELSQKVHASIEKNALADKVSKAALEKQKDVLEAQTDQIEQQRETLKQQAQRAISDISQQLPALEAQLQTAILEIETVRSQIVFNRSLLALSQNNPQGPVLSNNFNFFQLQQSLLVLNSLRANANTIANAIAIEQNKISRVRAAYDAEVRKLNQDIKKTANLKRRNTNELVKIAQGAEPDAGAVAALNNRTSALSIYDPLPLEQFRADFLRQLR